MNVLSLFDGISGAQVALERAGIPVENYFASEIDKWAIQITQKNYPNTIQLGDVREWDTWVLPKIDLVIGGSPCQGFSTAGKQLNFEDPRSQLFFYYTSILQEIDPEYFLLENVRMKDVWRKTISLYLMESPIEINSSLVSAQNRKRLYWCNWEVSQPKDKGILLRDVIESGEVDREKSLCLTTRYKDLGISQRTLGKRYFEKKMSQVILTEDGSLRKLIPLECERLQTYPDGYTEGVSNTQRYKALGNSFTVDVITHLLKELK